MIFFLPSEAEKKRSRVDEGCYSPVAKGVRLSVASGEYWLLGGVGVICDTHWKELPQRALFSQLCSRASLTQ